MKSYEKLVKLAYKFESKLYKYASEVDSTAITAFIRGTVSKAFSEYNLEKKLASRLTKIRDSEWEKDNKIFGNIIIGNGGVINASKDTSGWVIKPNTSLKKTGSLLNNKLMEPVITEVYNDFCNKKLFPAIKAVLDSYSNRDPKWALYTTITDYEMPADIPNVFVEL
jgi:hypothetical protein